MDAARRKRDSKRSKSFITSVNGDGKVGKSKPKSASMAEFRRQKLSKDKRKSKSKSLDLGICETTSNGTGIASATLQTTSDEEEVEMSLEDVSDTELSEAMKPVDVDDDEDLIYFLPFLNEDITDEPSNGIDSLESEQTAAQHQRKTLVEGISYRKFNCNTLLVSILPNHEFHFNGKCRIEVLKGTIEVLGFKWNRYTSKRQVFSPKGYSLLSVVGVSENEDVEFPDRPVQLPELLTQEELDDIPGAVFLMEGFETSWCEGMRKYCLEGNSLFGRQITGIGPGKVPKLKFLQKKLGFRFLRPNRIAKSRLLEISFEWKWLISSITNEMRSSTFSVGKFAIFGGKGVGKSTFSRWLTNKMLNLSSSVIYIDLDPGQAEFTPPGLLSIVKIKDPLLGPNFANQRETLLSIFLGSLDVTSCPLTYLVALREIRDFVANSSELNGLPWIINTMGFTRGLGLDFACEIIRQFEPTHVLQIQSDNQRRSFEFDLQYDAVSTYSSSLSRNVLSDSDLRRYRYCSIDSICESEIPGPQENQWGSNASDLRNNMMVSYFAESIGQSEDADLASVIPVSVPLSTVAIGTLQNQQDLSYESILRVMNGNLVALCECPVECILATQISPTRKILRINNPSDGLLNCIGLGLVRAYDKDNAALHIITPVPTDTLKTKFNSVITASGIGLPLQFFTKSFQNVKPAINGPSEIPYVMDTRISRSKMHKATRKNFVPKKITHNVLKKSFM